jgi:hypothetical protein
MLRRTFEDELRAEAGADGAALAWQRPVCKPLDPATDPLGASNGSETRSGLERLRVQCFNGLTLTW